MGNGYIDYPEFRYKTDSEGYITDVFFGCTSESCKGFSDDPNLYGYNTWEEWASNEIINAWKIVNFTLVRDKEREARILARWKEEERQNETITRRLLSDILFDISDFGSRIGSVRVGNLGIEWGLAEVTSGTSGTDGVYTGNVNVVFDNKYKAVPGVTTSWAGKYANQISTSSFETTTSGCGIAGRMTDPSSTRKIQWIAIGILANDYLL